MKYCFSNKEEITDTYNTTEEPQKLYANFKKPFTKDHTLYDSIYVKHPENAII